MGNQADNGDRLRASEAARALGRLGGLKGGPARKAAMTPEQRSEAARKAVQARWAKVRARVQGIANPEAIARWRADLREREKAMEAFAKFSGGQVQEGGFVGANGLFMILHFDLMTISPDGAIDRSATYDRIRGLATKNGGMRLSKSVYLIPLLPKTTSLQCAAKFWNSLRNQLKGGLVVGDSFYLHYVPDQPSRMGGIGHIVGDDRTLEEVKLVA